MLINQVLGWWLDNASDTDNGGVYTFLHSDNITVASTDKYVWAQGRWTWLLARCALLAEAGRLPGLDTDRVRSHALRSARFLAEHTTRGGRAVALVSQAGAPKPVVAGDTFHSSIFADLFVALGLSAAARLNEDEAWADQSEQLLRTAMDVISEPSTRTDPLPYIDGYQSFAPRMIALNTAIEVFRLRQSPSARSAVDALTEEIQSLFVRGTDLAEFAPYRPGLSTELIARHRNPGHALEGLWFLRDVYSSLPGMHERRPLPLEAWGTTAITSTLARAWDPVEGGLFRYVDKDGGIPRGSLSNESYESSILSTWDQKLWWPHAEALAALEFCDAEDPQIAYWSGLVRSYVFDKFIRPNGDWNKVLDRRGRAVHSEHSAIAPLRDSFHQGRALLLLAVGSADYAS